MNTVKIKSRGKLGNSEVWLNGQAIADLLSIRVVRMPDVPQTGFELTYLEKGSIKRFAGMNEGDELDFHLQDDESEVFASHDTLSVQYGSREVFPGAAYSVDIFADGWSLQMNAAYNLKAREAKTEVEVLA